MERRREGMGRDRRRGRGKKERRRETVEKKWKLMSSQH